MGPRVFYKVHVFSRLSITVNCNWDVPGLPVKPASQRQGKLFGAYSVAVE